MRRRALLLAAAALAALLAPCGAGGNEAVPVFVDEHAAHVPRDHLWNYTLTPHMLARSVGYEGSSDALRRMVAKLDAGGSAVVSVIGGSVSRGHGGPDGAGDHNAGHPGSWSRLIYDYINARWPGRHHVYANGAVPATGSPYFAQCLARHLHKEADLVLLEFAVNDGHNNQGTVASVETIVRRVTRERGGFGSRPAIALVHWYDRWPGREEGRESRGSSRSEWKPEWDKSVEGLLSPLSMYYDVASLSMRNALLYDDLRKVPGFAFDDFSVNWNHPNVRGHRMMADPMIYLIARVADGMAHERASVRVAEAHARTHNGSFAVQAWGDTHAAPPPPPGGDPLWLPPPLVEGNDSEMREPVCSYGEELHRLVTRADGFAYIEDAEKPGFLTNTSGAVLELAVGRTYQAITFSYLRSYRPGMGEGVVTCVSGCTCDEQKIDARSKGDVSVMVQHQLSVTAAQNCTLRITAQTLPPLPIREAKGDRPGATFKVMGVTVTGLQVAPHGGSLGGEMPIGTLHGISHFDASASPPPPQPPAAPVARAPPVRLHPARDAAPVEEANATQQANATLPAGAMPSPPPPPLPSATVNATAQPAAAAAPPPSPEPPMPPALDALPAR